jgi:hypothetical protein
MPESVVREDLESLNIHVKGGMQLRSGRRDQNPANDRPPTPHFIVSVTRGSEVSKVRSITQLCGLRVTVETYVAPKGASDTLSLTADTHNCASLVGASTSLVDALPLGDSLSAVAAGATTQQTIVTV